MPNLRGLLQLSRLAARANASFLDEASRLYVQEAGAVLVIAQPQYVTGRNPIVFLASTG
jgi:hypothetical protein